MRRKRQNRKGAPGRVLCPLLAFVLTAGFIIGMPPISGEALAVELDRECSLQVVPVEEGGSAAEGQPGERVDVSVDLYLVAEAREVRGQDSYDFIVKKDSPYYSMAAAFMEEQGEGGWEWEIDAEGLTFRYSPEADSQASGWEEFSARASAAILVGEEEPEPFITGEAGSRIENLKAGLYLMAARGSSLESREEYVSVDTLEGEEVLSTIAYTDESIYRFSPQLISLPTKEPEGGTVSTAGSGEWLYALNGMELKFDLDSRYTSLEIVKNLDQYVNPAAFVFQVEAREGDRVVYSDIVTISFDGSSGTGKSVVLEEKIPAGCDVTVTEVYSGASYSLTALDAGAEGETPDTAYAADLAAGRASVTSISAGTVTRVTFTNSYNGSGNSGGAVTNHFEREGADGDWNWNQYQYNGNSGLWEWNGSLPAVMDATVR